MTEKTYDIAYPEHPGVYEAKAFPIDKDLGYDEQYAPIYVLPTGAWYEGNPYGEDAAFAYLIYTDKEKRAYAEDFGPFRALS